MSTSFKPIFIKTFKIAFPLVLGLSILWWVYRETNFSEVLSIWKSGVRFDIIALSLPFGIFANIIRAYRWNLLIKPLGEQPRKLNLVYAVLGNYTVNYVFTRMGEVWRCGVISKYEKIPFAKLFGTLLIDRLADALSVLLIVAVCFGLNISFFETFLQENPEFMLLIQGVFGSPWLYIGIALVISTIIFILSYFKDSKIIRKIKELLLHVWEGIKTVWHMKDKWQFLFYTFLIWLGYFFYFYICFFAFDFTKDLGWRDGLTAFGLTSIAVAIPVPGAMGTWHAATSSCLVGFGVAAISAKSFAFIVYLIQNVFTALAGMFGIIALPIINKKK